MDRRSANLSALSALLLVAASFHVEAVSTHCTPDGAGNGKTTPMSMATVVSSATTRAEPADTTTAKAENTERKAATVELVQTTIVSNPATAGGGVAGGGDDGVMSDGPAPQGVHKRGLRWQSFLPGVIK